MRLAISFPHGMVLQFPPRGGGGGGGGGPPPRPRGGPAARGFWGGGGTPPPPRAGGSAPPPGFVAASRPKTAAAPRAAPPTAAPAEKAACRAARRLSERQHTATPSRFHGALAPGRHGRRSGLAKGLRLCPTPPRGLSWPFGAIRLGLHRGRIYGPQGDPGRFRAAPLGAAPARSV